MENIEINGKNIEIEKMDIISANILEVKTGTNGYCGGDTGHGSRTYFELTMHGGDMEVVADKENNVCIKFGGDTELETFIGALKFAAKTLKNQIEKIKGVKI